MGSTSRRRLFSQPCPGKASSGASGRMEAGWAMSPINLVGISASLRSRPTNTEVLRAAALLAPPSVQVTLFAGLAALPHFNPDLDVEGRVSPARVRDLRPQVAKADGLLICSPEYAHGVPGALKNALDWLVSGPEILYMPI